MIVTGEVGDDELAALYTGAHALVLPSAEEGFGLPAIEALACGTPVVAADGPALREVLDGRATFVDPGDVDGLVAAAHAATTAGARPAGLDVGGRRGRDVGRLRAGARGLAGAGAPEVPARPARRAADRARARGGRARVPRRG